MELTLAEFVLMVLLGSTGLVFATAVVSRTLHARVEAKSLQHRVICRLCLHAFEDHGGGALVRCPACHAENERGRGRRLG
jgi:hypothetical protein